MLCVSHDHDKRKRIENSSVHTQWLCVCVCVENSKDVIPLLSGSKVLVWAHVPACARECVSVCVFLSASERIVSYCYISIIFLAITFSTQTDSSTSNSYRHTSQTPRTHTQHWNVRSLFSILTKPAYDFNGFLTTYSNAFVCHSNRVIRLFRVKKSQTNSTWLTPERGEQKTWENYNTIIIFTRKWDRIARAVKTRPPKRRRHAHKCAKRAN